MTITQKTQDLIDHLRMLVRDKNRDALKKGESIAITSKEATELFLATNCKVKTAIKGYVHKYEVKHKRLGAGVYRVWLEQEKTPGTLGVMS